MILFLGNGCNNSTQKEGQKQNILNISYSGSNELGSEFLKVMEHPEVQQLFLNIAESPRSVDYIENALNEIDFALSDLINLKLVRKDGDQVELAFILYTREDMDLIRAVAEKMGKLLANDILVKRSDIESIVKNDMPSGVDWCEIAFFVIGCVSLDWDGLRISENNGFLTQPEKSEYIPQAIQPGGGGSNCALY